MLPSLSRASRWGDRAISDVDVLSHALYPKVFDEWQQYMEVYGEVGELDTNLFLKPLVEGQEVSLDLEPGKDVLVKIVSLPQPDPDGNRRCILELNGERWFVPITDTSVKLDVARREKAVNAGEIGSPMPGVVVDVKVKKGDIVKEGDKIAVLSAMKMVCPPHHTSLGAIWHALLTIRPLVPFGMPSSPHVPWCHVSQETVIPATKAGEVTRILVNAGDSVEGDDLLAVIE